MIPMKGMCLVLAVATTALAAGSTAAQETGIAHGKALVEHNCASCHAIGRSDVSKHAEAPPLRTLSDRYPLEALEEAFVEGIVTGHPDMPQFIATPEQIADIIAFIETLNP